METANKRPFAGFITFVIALAIYLLTMPHDLTWTHFGGDGGELITASLTLGVPHPPGYPTYVLLGKLFSMLPGDTAVFKFHLFSAISTALAAAILTQTAFVFNQPQRARRAQRKSEQTSSPFEGGGWGKGEKNIRFVFVAISAGLLFAFTPLVWGQAIIAEVYALNVLLVSLVLWALLTKRPCWLVGLLLGLAITTHLTSFFLLPVAIFSILKREGTVKQGMATPCPYIMLLFVGVGLLPFLLLPILARGNSPIVWGDQTTLRGWWWLVSGEIYQPNQFAFAQINYAQKAQDWLSQLTWSSSLLILLAIPFALKNARSHASSPHPLIPSSLLATAVFYLFYAFTNDTNDSVVLILPAIFILCLLIVPTLAQLERFALALPLFLLLLNFNAMNLRDDPGIRPYAEQLLSTVPDNAVLITDGDPALFALWYLHFGAGQRTDVAIVDNHLFAFDWYRTRLQQTYPDLVVPQEDDLQKLQTEQGQKRPFCQVNITHEDPPDITNSCAED